MPHIPNAADESQLSVCKLTVSSGDGKASIGPHEGPAPVPEEAPAFIARREFEFPGDLASVAESREQIMQFICQHCPDQADQIDILVALQEALVNAALHGCGGDAAKRIHCTVEAGPLDIAISVRDPGPGFDLALADPDSFVATTHSNGRGIHLIRSLMTEVSFACGGSKLNMRKCIPQGRP